MSNVSDHPERERLQRDLANLKSGGGDGTFDGMEARVRQLETDMAYIKGKLEDMPTKDWMTTRLIWVVGAFVVASGVIQVIIELI